tara:strand:+ start:2152 stop:10935 length:8784 start_codon:yes stop_codon:yes gene_type:complete
MDKFTELYNYLKEEGLTDLSAEEFEQEYQAGTAKNKELFSYLKEENMTDLDNDTFNSKYFSQKKNPNVSGVLPPPGEDLDGGGTPPPVEEVSLDTTPIDVEQEADPLFDVAEEDIVEEVAAYDPNEQGKDDVIKYDKNASQFEKSLAYITPDLIDREEEEVVNRMNYHFSEYDFKFEEGGGFLSGMDGMTVTAGNGKTLTVNLDPIMGDVFGGETKGSRELIDFLEKNRKPEEEMDSLSSKYDNNRKKYFSSEAAMADVNDIQNKAKKIRTRTDGYLETTTVHEQAMERLLEAPREEQQTSEWKIAYQNQLAVGKRLNVAKEVIGEEIKEFQTLQTQVRSSVGSYMSMKENDGSAVGNYFKGLYNSGVAGIGKMLASAVGTGIDVIMDVNNSLVDVDPNSAKGKYRKEKAIEIAKDMGYDVPEGILDDDVAYEKWYNGLKDLDLFESEKSGDGTKLSLASTLNAEGKKAVKESGKKMRNINGKLEIWNPEGGVLFGGAYEEVPESYYDKTGREKIDRLVVDAEKKMIKNPVKEGLKGFLDNVFAFDDVSDERYASMLNQKGATGILLQGLDGLAQSSPAILLSLLSKGKIKPTGVGAGLRSTLGKALGLTTGGAVAQTLGFSLLQAESMNEEMNNDPDFKYVTETERKKLVLPTAVTVGILERYGLRNIVGNKAIMTSIMSQATKLVPKGAKSGAFGRAVEKIVKSNLAKGIYSNKYIQGTGVVAKAGLAEAETGALQQVAEMGYKEVWNSMYEKDMFEQPDFFSKDYLKEVAHAAATEAVGGFVLGIPQALVYDYNNNNEDLISDEVLELFDIIRNDKITVKAFESDLNLKVEAGTLTKEEAAEQLLQFNTLSGAANTLPIDLDVKSRKKALGLVFEQQKLETEMEGMNKDLGLYKDKEARVKEIKEDLSTIGKEQATDNASIESESEGISESNLVTKEDAKKSLKKQGINNPTNEQIKTEQDALQIRSTEEMVSKESTESSSKVEQDVLEPGTPGKSSENKPKGNKTKNKEEVTPEEQGDVDEYYGDNVSESVETPTSNLRINNKQEKGNELKDSKLAQAVIKYAKKGAKAIQKIAPNVKIVLHKSNKEFEKFAPKGKGYYNPGSGIIHINLTNAKASTVAHEIFHAVFIEKIKNGDKGSIAAASKLILSIRKTLPKDSMLAKRIDAFAKQYKGDAFQNEEEVAELFGIMASEYKTLTKPSKNKVIEFIRKIAKKFGINIPSNFTSTDEGVVDFLNTFSSKVREGKVVEEIDLIILDEINEQIEKEGTAPIGNPTEINKPQKGRQQKINFDENYPLSLVTPDKKIDINSLIDDVADKKEKVWFWVADQLGLGEVDGIKMDAGPSFPLQPENLKKKAIWASGLDNSKLSKNINAADYIFIISGSPETSKLFNKKVFDKYVNDLGNYTTFKKDALATNPTKAIRETLEEFDSWQAMRRSPKRKNFLIGVNEQSKKPNTNFHALIKNLGGFVNLQSLRDGFYKDNQFAQNDIMMVLKPTGLGGNSNHSTYSTDILGEVVGVPDTKINAREIVPEEIKRKIDGTNISVQTSSIAPYGGSTKTAVKTITKPQKGRQQKNTEQNIIDQTYMPDSGYYSKQAMVSDIQRQWDRISPGYKAIRAKEGAYGGGGGVYVLNPSGKRIFPGKSQKGRQQKMDNENDLLRIIIAGREEAGFRDAAIKDYLLRRKKVLNGKTIPLYSASEINKAFDLLKSQGFDAYMFREFPSSFNNIKGGFLAGLKLMNKVDNFYKKLVKANNLIKDRVSKGRKTKEIPLTEEQIREKVIEYFTSLNEYKNEGAKGGKLTSQQMAMEKDMLEVLLPDPLKANPERIRAINKRIKEIKFDEKNIKGVQRALRNYIRAVLPRSLYTKSEIIKLIDKVNRINKTNFESVTKEVFEIVTKKTNESLQSSVFNILNKSYRTIQSGRLKGVKIDNETRKKLDRINAMIVDPKSTADQINKANQKLRDEFDKLSREENEVEVKKNFLSRVKTESRSTVKTNLSEDVLSRMAELTIAININDSFSLEMNDAQKTTFLANSIASLNQIEQTGRAILEYQLLKDAVKYRENERKVFKDMTGIDLDGKQSLIDQGFNEADISELMINEEFNRLKKDISLDEKRGGGLNPKTVAGRFKMGVKEVMRAVETTVFGSAEDLTGLIDRISTQPGEVFGGATQDIVSKAIRGSSRIYKGRMMNQQMVYVDKMTELFGKKWMKVNRKNSQETETIILSEAKNKILLDKIAKIENENKKLTTEQKEQIKDLNKKIAENTLNISQNQLMYYYAQMQDPSLNASMINTFNPTGLDSETFKNEFESRIKNEIESKLDPKLADFAKWLVSDYYPSVYNHYNETYKKIYRTDMPWNQFYAGRVYRQNEDDAEGLDLLADNKSWISNVAAGSSKARQENTNPIQKVDGMDAMLNYTKDMEYFAAYAEAIRDINKIFTSPAIKETIDNKFGKDISRYINDVIQKIANKGVQNQRTTKIINFFNNTFLFSRLGLNPTLTLKQMTSFVTYGNDIGYYNWLKFQVKGLPKFKSTVKEIMNNSVVLQDRYGQPITRAVETYSDSKFERMNGGMLEAFGLNSQTLDTATRVLMFTTMAGDKGAIIFGGLPNYLYYKNEYKTKNPNATEQQAIDYAIIKFEADTLRTQQSYDLQDKDYYQTKGVFERAFNMFLTTPKQYFRREIIAARNMYRIVKSGGKEGKGVVNEKGDLKYWSSLGKSARSLAVYHVVMPVFFQWVSQGLPGLFRDYEDDDTEDLGMAAVLGNLNALFILGNIAETVRDAITEKPWAAQAASIPVLSQTANLARLYGQVQKTKDPAKKREYLNKFIAEAITTVGIPAPQIEKFFQNWGSIGDSKSFGDVILKLFNFSQYAQGKRSKKSSGGFKMTDAEKRKYMPELYKEEQQRKKDLQESPGYIREQELKLEAKKAREEYLDQMYN